VMTDEMFDDLMFGFLEKMIWLACARWQSLRPRDVQF